MSLEQLDIHHLRNITSARLHFHPQWNVFMGANGSGKTSLLEAIYLLGTGHSFRTRETSPLIEHGNEALMLFARTHENEIISLQKSPSSPTLVKINQTPCYNSSELARLLPCQVIYQDVFEIIEAGPTVRRQIMDWGLFHVKQEYHEAWKHYARALKQRNALLRQSASQKEFTPWNDLLHHWAEQLDEMRRDYFQKWSVHFQLFLKELTEVPCDIEYYKGWDKKNSGKLLKDVFSEQFAGDVQRQYTQSGAHQADVIITSEDIKAKQWLSRGQQKIILMALKLAQSDLLNKPCLYLLDDVLSELDDVHAQRLLACIKKLRGQFFLTGVDSSRAPLTKNLPEASHYTLQQGNFRCTQDKTHKS
jgi:DNA replication and repair protein RecF